MKLSPPHVALTLAMTVFTGVITYHLASGHTEPAPASETEQLDPDALAKAPAVQVPMAPAEPDSVPAPLAPMAETPEAEEAPQVASAPRPPSQKASKPTAAAKPKAAREPTEPAGQEAALAPKAEEADDHTEEPEGETAAADEAKDTKPQVAKAPTRKPAQPKPAAEVASASTTPTVPGYGQVVGAEAEAYDEAGEQATEGEAAPGVDEEAVAEVTEPRKRRKRTALTATQKKKIDRLQESWKSLGEALEDLGSESGR